MADERTGGAGKSDASAAHAGPTIDLDASQVTEHATDKTDAEETAPQSADEDAPPPGSASGPAPRPARSGAGLLLAGLGGGVVALAVAGGLWFWFDGFPPASPQVTAAQFDGVSANVDALATRLAKAEIAAAVRPLPSVDPALMRRTEAAEAAFVTMRDELAAMKAQLAAAGKSLDDLKAEARTAAAPSASPDLARIDERLDRLDRAVQTLQAETAKRQPPVTEDINARRLAVASALDSAVTRGEPFAGQLAAAKQLAANAQALTALDAFAATGVPGEAVYLRRIVAILDQAKGTAAPQRAVAATPTEAGALDRLRAGFAKLVRIERADAPAAGLAAVPQRTLPAVSASDDLAGVRRDVAKLPQAAQPDIQAWFKSLEARDAALAASRAFANDALAAIAKSGQ